jgi:hypothetical protein
VTRPAGPTAVIVRAAAPARVAEALRGAVGLTLRGDPVLVVLGDAAAALADTPALARAVATLTSFGHPVVRGDAAIAAAVAGAAAVEVWSERASLRTSEPPNRPARRSSPQPADRHGGFAEGGVAVTLHLVRHAEPPPGVIAAADQVLYDRDGAWQTRDGAPVPDEALVDLLFRAARVAVW